MAPAATTEPLPICTPSITTALAPTKTLSPTRTGSAEAGSMTPARTAPAPMWLFLPTGRTAAQNRTHINHGTWTDFRTDVNHRAHHDNGIIANGHLIADNGTWLDTGIDITLVQQRHSRIAAVLLHHIVYIFSQVCQEWLDILPVTEEDIAKLCHFSRNSSCQFSFKGHFNSCLLHSITDKSNDFLRSHFLCSHNVSNLKIIFFLLYQNFLKIWEEMQKNEKGSGKELD
ncbi:hypothetical protein SSU05_2045 [Streptococcus suis 05ZYH33]|nr:hypothetical protein SSU05_2045 [Streptococcus suis 05ZYH33]